MPLSDLEAGVVERTQDKFQEVELIKNRKQIEQVVKKSRITLSWAMGTNYGAVNNNEVWLQTC